MSIDRYTGTEGGGAVAQFFRGLPGDWKLDDQTVDGHMMEDVPVFRVGDLITLTIGGNNLLFEQERWLRDGLESFNERHRQLVETIRDCNPNACFVIGNVYEPQFDLGSQRRALLGEANAMIEQNARQVDGKLADIHGAFLGHEEEYLCLHIEPTLAGATVIADLFWRAFSNGQLESSSVRR